MNSLHRIVLGEGILEGTLESIHGKDTAEGVLLEHILEDAILGGKNTELERSM